MPLQDANPTPSFGGFGIRNTLGDSLETISNRSITLILTSKEDVSAVRITRRVRANHHRFSIGTGTVWGLGMVLDGIGWEI